MRFTSRLTLFSAILGALGVVNRWYSKLPVCLWAFSTSPIVLREAEKKDMDIYEKIPLFQLEEDYGKTEAGRTACTVGAMKLLSF